jgi:hypothetical protein
MNFNLSLAIIPLILIYVCGPRQNTARLPASENTSVAQPIQKTATATPSASPSPRKELTLKNGLQIITKNVKMENKDWRYRIDVEYPQIEGTNDRAVVALNRQVKDLVTKTYSWPLSRPNKEDFAVFAKWPGFFNSVDLDYDIVLATDKLLSIYFIGYHYGIGAAHSVHASFTINYDFESHRPIALASLFKPGANFLDMISRKCMHDLSEDNSYLKTDSFSSKLLAPRARNFESWNITDRGLRFNFEACRVNGCAAGDLSVEIPFDQFAGLIKWPSPIGGG